MKLSGIFYECKRDAYISSWNFDPPAMKAGDTAKVAEVLVAAPNPLYLFVPENGDKPFAWHREEMLKYGEFKS